MYVCEQSDWNQINASYVTLAVQLLLQVSCFTKRTLGAPFTDINWLTPQHHMSSEVWHEVTYPFPNFSGCTIEVWQRTSNFITHFIMEVIIYPSWIKVNPAISVDGSLADARRNIDVSGTTSDVILSDVVMKSSLRHMFTKKLLLAELSLRAHCLFRN